MNTNEKNKKINIIILPPYMRKIDNNKLILLYTKIKPIISIQEKKYKLNTFTLEQLLKNYNWNSEENKTELIDSNSIEIITDFLCLHTHKEQASLEEILSQIPDDITNFANAFEVIEAPEKRENLIVHAKGLHLSKIRIYKINE